jgi:hypothetical protein
MSLRLLAYLITKILERPLPRPAPAGKTAGRGPRARRELVFRAEHRGWTCLSYEGEKVRVEFSLSGSGFFLRLDRVFTSVPGVGLLVPDSIFYGVPGPRHRIGNARRSGVVGTCGRVRDGRRSGPGPAGSTPASGDRATILVN